MILGLFRFAKHQAGAGNTTTSPLIGHGAQLDNALLGRAGALR
jgi:hypothetical protein